MKILFIITSYKRPHMLNSLLRQLKGQDIIVFDDNSNFTIEGNGIQFHKFKENYGKKRAWLKFKKIFEYLNTTDYDYYYLLPDDIELCEDFIVKTLELWEGIEDNKKICLSFANPERCKISQFTRVQPVEMGNVILTGWLDMAFMCTENFINKVDMTEILLSRWDGNELLGSGCGSQISNKFVDDGYNLYNTKDMMMTHLGNNDSKMNYEERLINPL